MNIVIVGGTGFIGKHLVRTILSNGSHKLIIIDNLSNSNLQGFHEFIFANNDDRRINKDRLAFHQVDVRNKDDVHKVFKKQGKVDVCIHLAARVSIIDSLIDPESTFATNVVGTQNVLSSASQAGAASFVFASSAAVYGVPRRLPVSEEDPTEPISAYGKSKLLGEELVSEYSSKFRNATTLRIFNAYGKGQTIRYGGVITRFAHRILKDLPPIIYGDGYQTRDFISIDDVIRSIIIAGGLRINVEGKDGGGKRDEYGRKSFKNDNIFNVGTGKPTNILCLAQIMTEIIRGANCHHRQPVYESLPEADIGSIHADIKKSCRVLGFSYKDDLRSGLGRMFFGSRLNLE